MNSVIDKEFFLVRTNQTDLQYYFNFNTKKFTHACITSISIPKTFYVIPQDTVLYITENKVEKSIPISVGNYNVRSLASILKAKINTLCTYTYDMKFPNSLTEIDTNKFTLSVSGNGADQPTILSPSVYLAHALGFEEDTEYTFDNNTLVSINTVNFQSYDEILLKADCVKNQDNLLQEIYNSGELPYGASIVWTCPDIISYGKELNNKVNGMYNFKLVDSDDSLINLNGSHWSFVICFFKMRDITDLVSKYIDYKLELIDEKLLKS